MRANGNQIAQTVFEAATDEELELAFFHIVDELLVNWGHLQGWLGNFVVSHHNSIHYFAQFLSEYSTPLLMCT